MTNTTRRFKLLRFKRLTKIWVGSELQPGLTKKTSKVKPNTDNGTAVRVKSSLSVR